MKRSFLLITLAAAFIASVVAGCAPSFPKELLDKVEKDVSYRAFQDEPEKYDGKFLMFGGTIVEAINQLDGARIVVLQRPLGSGGQPAWTGESGGRFMIITQAFIDIGAFHRGRSITVIGEVDGSKVTQLSGTEYWYPLLVARSLHLW